MGGMMKRLLLTGIATIALPGMALANCPGISLADMQGVAPGEFPQQYELAEFEAAAGCTMEFSANPDSASLNARIKGNPDLPELAARIPSEPLVVVPYDSVGKYGGTFDALSNATEAGTSDFLSIRHVNLVRYSDDLQTIVPNIAKSWSWNDDFTQLTFSLRAGHKWSDGAPFTSADVKYWYDNLALNPNVIAKPKDYVLVAGERMTVDTPDPQTVVFNLPSPKPGLLAHFATSFAQGFQPMHFLGQWDPELNADADTMAQAAGFENGLAVLSAYFGNSDWTDTPSPLLNSPAKVADLPKDVVPTLESHLTVTDTTEGRHYVANPYFFQVDTAGNQLPYISEQDEVYINDNEVRILKLVNAEVDYKAQSLGLSAAPLLLENQEKGDYTVELRPAISINGVFSFNLTSEDPGKRAVFGDLRFRKAMSIAMDRDEINEVANFGLGVVRQYIGFSPTPAFVDEKWATFATEYDPDGAKALLDEVGMVDTDGDGFRELPNGDKIVLNMQFAVQGIDGKIVEIVGQYWADVGVQTTVKEVTPDEYRSQQSSNQLDVGMWEKSQPLAIILGNNELWVPPFENYFGHRTGLLWAEWVDSDGASGVEPPDFVKQLMADVDAFQSTPAGTPESDALGERLVANMTGNLLFIGTVLAPSPIYHRNALKNVPQFKTASYEYYRTYPYRGTQWWLDE
jgi:peptide/nickel transport system substrate-binding protein